METKTPKKIKKIYLSGPITGLPKWAENNGYSENLTIDRIDPLGNYEPTNCRWITIQEQQRNKRKEA